MKFTNAIKSHFKNGLLEKKPGTKWWTVKKEFIFYLCYTSKREYIVVGEGFKTDFGSIPKLFQNIFSATQYISYIFHDKLYSKRGMIEGNKRGRRPSRYEADCILITGLKVEGMGVIKRVIVFLTLRLFGWIRYK